MLSQLPNIVPSPPLWQLIRWVADPISVQINCNYRCGDIFTMRLAGLGPFVIIGNPQAIQEIFSQDAQFDVGRTNELAKPLIGENSLMLLDGERHRKE